MAALWTEICLAMPAIQAIGEGYEVYVVTDASGGVSVEAHEMAIHRMIFGNSACDLKRLSNVVHVLVSAGNARRGYWDT